MHRTIVMWVALATVLTVSVGCTPGYNEHNKQAASDIAPRVEWTITGSPSMSNLPLALDGNMSTAATSGSNQSGAWVALDLGRVCLFNTVIVEHGLADEGFAGRVAVHTSMDGTNFTYRFTGPGNRGISYFSLVTPVLARYVRLEVSQPGAHVWSLAELNLR